MQRSQPFAGVDGRLGGHFVRRALLQKAADAAVEILGVLADHDKVDVVRALAGQRRFDARVEFDGPQVDVLIQLKPQFQQQSLFQDSGRHVRMADGAQEDGVERAQLVDRAGRQYVAGAQVAVAAEVKLFQFVLEPFQRRDGLQHLECFGGDFGARSIAADDGDLDSVVLVDHGISTSVGMRCRKVDIVATGECLPDGSRLFMYA